MSILTKVSTAAATGGFIIIDTEVNRVVVRDKLFIELLSSQYVKDIVLTHGLPSLRITLHALSPQLLAGELFVIEFLIQIGRAHV